MVTAFEKAQALATVPCMLCGRSRELLSTLSAGEPNLASSMKLHCRAWLLDPHITAILVAALIDGLAIQTTLQNPALRQLLYAKML